MFSIENKEEAIEFLNSLKSKESEYIGKLRVEYKKSSTAEENKNDKALILCGNSWVEAKHFNYELDTGSFINIQEVRSHQWD